MRKIFLIFVFASAIISQTKAQQLPAKVGYADTDYILAQMPETKLTEDKLKETEAKLQNDYTTKLQQFQKQYADYTANAGSMTDTLRASNEKQLQQLSGELKQFEQDAQKTLENTRKLYMANAYLQVGRAINQVAAENGFYVILPKKIGNYNFLIYQDKKMNVSDLVLQKLGITPATTENKPAPDTKKVKQ